MITLSHFRNYWYGQASNLPKWCSRIPNVPKTQHVAKKPQNFPKNYSKSATSLWRKQVNHASHLYIPRHFLTDSDRQEAFRYSIIVNMPRKQRIVVQSSSRPQPEPTRGFLSTAYREVTSSENASIVRSIVIFGVSLIVNCLFRTKRRMGRQSARDESRLAMWIS